MLLLTVWVYTDIMRIVLLNVCMLLRIDREYLYGMISRLVTDCIFIRISLHRLNVRWVVMKVWGTYRTEVETVSRWGADSSELNGFDCGGMNYRYAAPLSAHPPSLNNIGAIGLKYSNQHQ